ncbi:MULTISPECIES: transposase [unclassified Streptomyces]|uniref:transposase n=1 Tax=unclassified Streptomyces TaxID=2593676 RepID=UPI00380C8667
MGSGRRGWIANTENEVVSAAFIYVLVSGCTWGAAACFGASKPTVHRWFVIWSRAGVWGRLHKIILDQLAASG